MTESEWLNSTDPAAMLAALNTWHVGTGPMQQRMSPLFESGRKMRLVACALSRLWMMHNTSDQQAQRKAATDSAELLADGLATDDDEAVGFGWAMWELPPHEAANDALTWQWSESAITPTGDRPQEDQASILRDIFGNPWRPVTLPHDPACRVCGGTGRYLVGRGEDAESYTCRCCPWLTDTVVALAQAAYDERPGRKCDRCGGSRERGGGNQTAVFGCDPCHGTGTIADGRLDPERLGVLADALEDVGCDPVECPACEGEGKTKHRSADASWIRSFDFTVPCEVCNKTGRVPHPLLAHLRGPGPHWRGCWALDLILGKNG